MACIQIFRLFDQSSPVLYKCAFSLAMANSGMNPVIYAWKNQNFRRAFALLLRCKNPDIAYRAECNMSNNYVHRQHNSNNPCRNAPLPSKQGPQNKPVSALSGSENASVSDQESQCSSSDPQQLSITYNQNNSHSLAVDEVATITGHLAIEEAFIEDEQQRRRVASGSTAFSTTSSTGTEITDDSSEP